MDKIEDVLNLCGCKGEAFDNKTGHLTPGGQAALKKLESILNMLDDLHVVDGELAMTRLKNILTIKSLTDRWNFEDGVSAKLAEMAIGKTLYTHNSWNGSSMTIKIEEVKRSEDSVIFTGRNHWDGQSGIYVPIKYLEELIATGEAVRHETIDHCDVRTRWQIG